MRQQLSEEFRRMQKLAGIITEVEKDDTKKLPSKEEIEKVKQEVFNKVTNSPKIRQEIEKLLDSLPKEAIDSLANNLSAINITEGEENISAEDLYPDLINLFLKQDALNEIDETQLAVLYDQLEKDPNIQKEDLEQLKKDTAELLNELANKKGLGPKWYGLVSAATMISLGIGFGFSWILAGGLFGICAALSLLGEYAISKISKSAQLSSYTGDDFNEFVFNQINKYREERNLKPINWNDWKIGKYEDDPDLDQNSLSVYSDNLFLGKVFFNIFPEVALVQKLWKKNLFNSFLTSKQFKLFQQVIVKKYPYLNYALYNPNVEDWDENFAKKWKNDVSGKFEPLPIDQVINKNVDVWKEYAKLLKQNGLKNNLKGLELPDV